MSSKWRMAVATLVLLASPRHSAAQDVDLLVTSGSGGVAKAERSTPVRITIEAPQAPVAGDLVVEWGDARLVRAVHLASPAQHQFEVYPRTSEPEALVRVRFVPERGNARGVDLPLEVIASDREITLCVRSEGGSLPEAACTVTTDAAL